MGSWSFPDRIPKLELGNARGAQLAALAYGNNVDHERNNGSYFLSNP